MASQTPALSVRRDLNWGLVMIADEQRGEPPAPDGSVVTATPSGLSISVHHAQDVNLEGLAAGEPIPGFIVAIDCWLAAAPSSTTTIWAGDLDVPSGRLLIGDAERDDVLELGAGRWHVEVAADPPDYPGEVAIWFSK